MSTITIATIATQKINDAITKLELESYDSCKIWLEGYNSPSTKSVYKVHLTLFCKYYNIDPDSLIQLKADQLKTMVLNYIIHLRRMLNNLLVKQSAAKYL